MSLGVGATAPAAWVGDRATDLGTDLAAVGFRPCHDRGGYASDDLRLSIAAGWAVLEPASAKGNRAPRLAGLGAPGLWRPVAGPELERAHGVFELPLATLRAGNAIRIDDVGQNAFAEVLAWARATRPGSVELGDWSPPPQEMVRVWLPDGALTVRASCLARQGRLVHAPRRLAVEFPVARCPEDLDVERRAWLERVLADARMRWRLARIGLVDGEIRAEIDLTGAPPPVIEALLPLAVDALRCVVAWVLEPVQFLVDVTQVCADATLQPGWA